MRFPFFRPKNESGLDDMTAALFAAAFGGVQTKAGARVDSTTALASNAVAAAIAIRSRTMSSLPAHIFENGPKRRRATEHPSYPMMLGGPNPYMTWSQMMKWREMMVLLTGNAYARNTWKGGRVVRMDPLYGRCEPVWDAGDLVGYTFDPLTGPREPLLPSQVTHFKWDILTADGRKGRSLVDVAREAIGLDISAEEFLGRVLTNGAHLGVVLTTDDAIPKEQFEMMAKQLADGRGVAPANKPRIFTKGLKPFTVGINIKDADLESQRRYVNERIASMAGVPLPLLNDLTHGTYSNTEQLDLTYSKHDIMPTCVDVEQTLNKAWFVGRDAGKFYVKFDLNGLQRGDYKARMEGYEIGIRCGMYAPNDCLELEDRDGYEGGDVHVMQAQMVPVDKLGAAAALEPIVADAAERIRIRAAQNRERGRDEADTREFASKVLAPITAAHKAAGAPFDPDAVLVAALS